MTEISVISFLQKYRIFFFLQKTSQYYLCYLFLQKYRQKGAKIPHPRTAGFAFSSLLPSQLGATLLLSNTSESKHTKSEFSSHFGPSCRSQPHPQPSSSLASRA